MYTNNNANLKHPTLASIAHPSTLKNRQIHYDLWPQLLYVGDFI